MTDKPTITVDLETLSLALSPHDRGCAAALELGRAIADRRRELNAPAPGPWRLFGDLCDSPHLRDATGEALSPTDMRRAAMAPQLAEALRGLMKMAGLDDYVPKLGPPVSKLFARFDNPEE